MATQLLVVGLAGAALMGGLLAIALASGLSVEAAVSDPHELTRSRFLGVVSNAGVLAWMATITVCSFTAWITRKEGSGGRSRFFAASAAIALLLLVDDLFLVHEGADDVVGYFVQFDHTRAQKDVLEAAVFAVYGLVFLSYAVVFRSTLRSAGHRHFLVAAIAMFGVSVFLDFGLVEVVGMDLPDYRDSIDVQSLLEEGTKLVGIIYYAAFYVQESERALGKPAR